MNGAERFMANGCGRGVREGESAAALRGELMHDPSEPTHLVLLGGVLGEDEGALEAVREEEAAEVEVLGALDQVLDLGLVEVRRRKRLGGAEGRAERAACARRDESAAASEGARARGGG